MRKAMLSLYDYFRSSSCYRVRIALNLKQLDYQAIPIHLLNNGGEQRFPAYTKINPQSLVPTLSIDEQPLFQSLAIIEYLDEVYPQPPLLPTHAFEKAQVRGFAQLIASDIHPLNNLRVLQYLKENLKISQHDVDSWYQHWISQGLHALEQLIARNPPQDFCVGASPTLADICLIPQLYNAKRYHCDLSAYPNLLRIEANCLPHPAFSASIPQAETIYEVQHA